MEALVAFASLLIALAMLISSARHFSGAFQQSVEHSGRQIELAQEAYFLDCAHHSPSGASSGFNISSMPADNGLAIASKEERQAKEPLFFHVSASQHGSVYVEGREAEPV